MDGSREAQIERHNLGHDGYVEGSLTGEFVRYDDIEKYLPLGLREQETACTHPRTTAVMESDGTLVRCDQCGAGRGGLDKPWGPPTSPEPAAATAADSRAAWVKVIDDVVLELAQDESFCGFVIDLFRQTDSDKIASIQLVPCDLVGGNAARRVANVG